jgi:hypothetical protein
MASGKVINKMWDKDIFDGIINAQPDFYLGHEYANLLSSSTFPPNTNEFPSLANSPSAHSDAASSTGPHDDVSRSGGSVPAGSRRVVALAPAQANKSTPSGDNMQPPRNRRQCKRREQNRAA